MVAAQCFQIIHALKGTAPTGTAVIELVEAVPVKASVITDPQCLFFCDFPIDQGILHIFHALLFVCGNADIVQGMMFLLDLIDFLFDQVCL